MKAYTGVGSRSTPASIQDLMVAIAVRMAVDGYVLRSGGADGADSAFEKGCDIAGGTKEIYIPWDGFNDRSSTGTGVIAGVDRNALLMAESLHPAWSACKQGAKKLHARNCYQVLGRALDAPSRLLICWTPNGSGSGGTGQAIRLALRSGVTVHDLGNPDRRKSYEDDIV